MPQHRNGNAMSQPTAHTTWHHDPDFWSANRAEHRFANGYELVVFDQPATNGYAAQIGWELFGGIGYATLMASGKAASLREAKVACEAALVQLGGSQTSPKA